MGRFNTVVAPIASPNVCIQCELKYSSYGNAMLLTRMYHLAVFYKYSTPDYIRACILVLCEVTFGNGAIDIE